MYSQKFKLAGFTVFTAGDGLDGLEKMKLQKPDVVLMDIMMPNLNGLEALLRAKQDPAIRDIPIIMLTNLTGTAELQTAMDSGAVGYVIKSELVPSELVQKVRQLITKAGMPLPKKKSRQR